MKTEIIKLETKGISLNLVLPDYAYLAENFICHLCKNLVRDPHCCQKCQECFCMECFNAYRKKKNARCPNFDKELNKVCNNKLDEGFDITNREKVLISEIKLKCLNHQAGCDEILSYENFFKHVKNCNHRVYRCNNKDCDFQSTKEKVKEHKIACQFSRTVCDFCKEEIPSNVFNDHLEICEEVEKFCFFCKKNFKVKNIYSHNPACKRELINFVCEENMKKINEYEELLEKYQIIETEFKELNKNKSVVLLGKKKKMIIEDEEEEESKNEVDIESEGKKKEEEFEKNADLEDLNNNFNFKKTLK